jgi:hypothetical protein
MPRQIPQGQQDDGYSPGASERAAEARARAAAARAAAEEAERIAVAAEEQGREERERKAERLRKVTAAQARLNAKLDKYQAKIAATLPFLFDGTLKAIEHDVEEYRQEVEPLGEKNPDQVLIQHPLGLSIPFLRTWRRRTE